jgi:cyclic-di-AMP phosphodiesterase PgpH
MRLTADRPLVLPRPLAVSVKWARRHGLVTLAVVAAFLVMLVTSFVAAGGGSLFRRVMALDLGEVVPEDVIVDRDLSYVDGAATALKREARSRLVPPVFVVNEVTTASSLRAFGTLRALITREVAAGTDAGTTLKRLEAEGVIGRLDAREIGMLARQVRLAALLDAAGVLLQQTMVDGVFSTDDAERLRPDMLAAGGVVVQRGGRARQEIPLEAVTTPAALRAQLGQRVETLPFTEPERRLVALLAVRFAEPNCAFDAIETREQRQRVAEEVQPVLRALVKGQVIARKGDLVTEDVLEKVRAMGEDTLAFSLNSIVGTALYLLILFALASFRLGAPFLGDGLQDKHVLLAVALVALHHVLGALLAGFSDELGRLPVAVLVPTATFAMLASILVSQRLAVAITLVLALSLLLVARLEVDSFLFALLSGLAGCAAVANAEKRIDLVRAGAQLAVASVLVLLVEALLRNARGPEIASAAFVGAAHGLGCGLLVLGFLPILEHLLNAPTRFRLLELSDLNAPVFRKMLNQAAGTYNHSLAVASLAESACDAMGANALLARVGAYYHDIGKVDQAEYFIENQSGANRHDSLRPNLSAAIIKSHVRIGIEKGRDLGLPEEVIDFIAQHHGKGLISYFYDRAVNEDSAGDHGAVSPDDYSYPGDRPDTKESAVVMLADVVEAATRTLKRPTAAKLEKVVWQIILQRFQTEQLNASPLQFRELETIKKSFVQVLTGRFHSRIEYPKARPR